MKIWGGKSSLDVKKGGCYGSGEELDIREAKEAAKQIGIPHYVIDLKKEYQESVIQYFVNEYKEGKTPNPCVFCNAKIKFNALLKKAFSLGIDFDYFATGHYAQIKFDKSSKRYFLHKGIHRSKDQSYFLYRLKQSQLKKIMFPLGNKRKEYIKEIARKNGFAKYAEKKESQNFVECGHYASLLDFNKKGKIVDINGNVLGTHEGIGHYTMGQRKNLKIGGLKSPYYVLQIDAKQNIIFAGPKEFAFSKIAKISNLNWIINPELIERDFKIKLRYGMSPVKSIFILKNKKEAVIEFKSPQFAVTPGQSAVFYNKDVVLGGGIIK